MTMARITHKPREIGVEIRWEVMKFTITNIRTRLVSPECRHTAHQSPLTRINYTSDIVYPPKQKTLRYN